MRNAKRWLCALLLVSLLIGNAIPSLAAVNVIARGVLTHPGGANEEIIVRKEPDAQAEELKKLRVDDRIDIIGEHGERDQKWYVIDVQGVKGYIFHEYVKDVVAETPPAPEPEPEPEPAVDPDPAPAVDPDPAPAVDPDPAPAVDPDPAPAVDPDPAPPAVDPDPAPAVDPDPAPPAVDPDPAPAVDPDPAPPAVDPDPAPAVDPDPAPAVDPDPAPAVDPDPAPAVDPDPAPAVDPDPAPAVDPDPAPPAVDPDPAPAVDPDPAPPAVDPDPAPAVDPAPSTDITTGTDPQATTADAEAAANTLSTMMVQRSALATTDAETFLSSIAMPKTQAEYLSLNSWFGFQILTPQSYARVKNTDGTYLNLYLLPVKDTTPGKYLSYDNGTIVRLLSQNNEFYFVEINGQYGYMLKQYIDTTNLGTFAYINVMPRTVAATVYQQPNTSTPVGSLHSGMRVNVINSQAAYGWSQISVTASNGMKVEGYVQTSQLLPNQPISPTTGYVNSTDPSRGADMYLQASVPNSKIGTFPNGSIANVYVNGYTWSLVEINGQQGYIASNELSTTAGGTDQGYATLRNSSGTHIALYADMTTNSVWTTVPSGTRVKVQSRGTARTCVIYNGYYVYVNTADVAFDSSGNTVVSMAIVNNPNPRDRLNLRALPTRSASSLGQFYNGTQVRIYEYGSEWCYVEVNGIIGYMMTMYLRFDNAPTPGNVIYATVGSSNRLNLRAQPTTSSRSLGLYSYGTTVKVINRGADWCYVQVGSLYGYMATRYLSFSGTGGGSGGGGGTVVGRSAVVNNPISSQWLNLRELPSKSARVLGSYYNGQLVKILEYDPIWCRVEVNGIRGYMMTTYLRII